MRLCRYQRRDDIELGVYRDDSVLPLLALAKSQNVRLPESHHILDYLPGGPYHESLGKLDANAGDDVTLSIDDVSLLVPIPDPGKLLLLAGNYSKHIEEGGGRAAEQEQTFPYVFMKPPHTTMTNPGDPVKIPEVSPDNIDWELELAFIIGRQCKSVSRDEALDYVAGYTVVNDISDREFHPNPGRTERPNDKYFDWLHGKWHDTFCPVGPCVLPADEVGDVQDLKLILKVNGNVEQDANTGEMIFPVAAVIEFISSFVTLEPGDIVATGTPDGVGKAKGKFLKPGDQLEAQIEKIGVLRNPVE